MEDSSSKLIMAAVIGICCASSSVTAMLQLFIKEIKKSGVSPAMFGCFACLCCLACTALGYKIYAR
jgi:hypothetical protein